MEACMVAPTKIIAGLGMSLGIRVLQVPGTTGDYRTLFHRCGTLYRGPAQLTSLALNTPCWRVVRQRCNVRREARIERGSRA